MQDQTEDDSERARKKNPHHAGWASQVAVAQRARSKPSPLLEVGLLNFVQFLVNQHGQEGEQKDARSDAENPHGNREPANLRQQLCLLFLHV